MKNKKLTCPLKGDCIGLPSQKLDSTQNQSAPKRMITKIMKQKKRACPENDICIPSQKLYSTQDQMALKRLIEKIMQRKKTWPDKGNRTMPEKRLNLKARL